MSRLGVVLKRGLGSSRLGLRCGWPQNLCATGKPLLSKTSKRRNMRAAGKLKGKRVRGRQLGAAMHVAELLERKRTLLDDRQEASPDRLIALDHELEEIDDYLTRLEWAEAPPTAPH